ncbi:MAG: serine hydrolase [Candidatus Paceibacterota bacterium]|jgi:D-alanyl-D-alanine carboxypeptidase (penicillin-binding protein 5/6)
MKPNNKNSILLFILIIFALEAILFSIGNNKLNNISKNEEQKIVNIKNALTNVQVYAKAVSVYDIDSNIEIYGKNQNEKLPLASLIKTMTVLVALDDYRTNPTITIEPDALKQFGDFGFLLYEKWDVKNLAKFTLVASANDGAYALVGDSKNFLERMNSKARRIGMENFSFLNFTGLDFDEQRAGAYASAKDANIMAIYALKAHPDVFSATVLPEISLKSQVGFVHNIKNTNIILNKIPNILFSKTGFTTLVGGNLTIIFKNKDGYRIAITVLGSTQDGRFSDMEKLVNVLYN